MWSDGINFIVLCFLLLYKYVLVIATKNYKYFGNSVVCAQTNRQENTRQRLLFCFFCLRSEKPNRRCLKIELDDIRLGMKVLVVVRMAIGYV